MQSKALKASKRAPLSLSKREAQVRSELERFAPKFRGAVKAIALRHRWLGDLAVSFPALLFALAVRRRHVEVEAIMAGAQLGKPLNELAALARLPLWARKLPPEAFNGPIPDLPDGEILRRQIVNHIPRARKRMWDWVRIIAFASQWGQ